MPTINFFLSLRLNGYVNGLKPRTYYILQINHGTMVRAGITYKKVSLLYARLSLQVAYC